MGTSTRCRAIVGGMLCILWMAFPQTVLSIEKLVVGTTMDVRGVDLEDYYFGTIKHLVSHKGLVRITENGDIEADLAEHIESENGRIWTFRLKPGYRWHDGEAVTALDAAFSIDYLVRKLPVYKSHFSMIERTEIIDERTLRLYLTKPHPRFLVNLLVLRLIPKHIFAEVTDPGNFSDKRAAIGCGPYVFHSLDPAAGILEFRAFSGYPRGEPAVKHIVFRMFKNPDTLYLALRKGEIDLPYFYAAGTSPAHLPSLLRNPNLHVVTIPNTGVPNALFLNTHKPPLDSLPFRKAISRSIRYEEIARLLGGGYGSVANAGFVPRGSPEFIETDPLVYDPSHAKKILDQLGYIDRDGDGIRENNGRPLELELLLRLDISGNARLAELLKEYFRNVGISLRLRPADMAMFRIISDQDRSHTMLLSRTTPWGMMMWAGCGSGYLDFRNIGWSLCDRNDFLDIVNRMNDARNDADYRKAAADFQRHLATEIPVLALYWEHLAQPLPKRYTGWKINPMYGVLWEETWFHLQETAG